MGRLTGTDGHTSVRAGTDETEHAPEQLLENRACSRTVVSSAHSRVSKTAMEKPCSAKRTRKSDDACMHGQGSPGQDSGIHEKYIGLGIKMNILSCMHVPARSTFRCTILLRPNMQIYTPRAHLFCIKGG